MKNKNLVIFIVNTVLCIISSLLCGLMGSLIGAVAISALLFIVGTAAVMGVLFKEDLSAAFLKKNWPVVLASLFSLGCLLLIILRCYKYSAAGGTYSRMGTILGVMMIYMVSIFAELAVNGQWQFEKIFALQAAVFGIVFGMVFPMNTIADEPQHMRTAYNLSNIMMGIQSPEGAVMMRQDDADYDFSYTVYNLNDVNRYLKELSEPLKNGTLVPVYEENLTPQTLDYAREPRVFKTEWYQYIAPAAGITLGRLLKLNTISMYLLGRLFNLILYIAAVWFALKLLPAGKSILYTLSLNPISMQLAASTSRDVFRITSAALVVSLTLYLFFTEKEQIRFRKTAIGALIISSALLFPLRSYVYSLIALLPVFLYLYRKKWITGKRVAIFTAVCAVLFVIAIILKYFVFPGNIVEEPKFLLSWTNEYRYTKEVFINHPLFVFTFLKNTLIARGDYYVKTMIGYQLGWLDLNIPEYLVSAFLILMAVNTFRRDYESHQLSAGLRLTLFVFSWISVVLIIMGIAIVWTPVTSPVAEGVQGRYFLPIALPMLLALRGNAITANEKCDIYCICVQFTALILTSSFLITRLL